ncbi:MAG: MerR family transcriptional regulator [bacterium]
MSEESEETLSISQVSEKTGLPESTIRYYDREFGKFLNIARGSNNQRLFSDKNIEDLEYVRYLIKREELSVEEVKTRLEREKKFARRSGGAVGDEPDQSSESQTNQENIPTEKLEKMLEKFDRRLNKLEEQQEEIRRLLDMNLQRYNKLVDHL